MVDGGELPPDTVVGRWWRDELAEIDVLALSGHRAVLVGECRWQARDLTEHDLVELKRASGHLPPTTDLTHTTYAFWSRGRPTGALAGHPDVRTFTPTDLFRTQP